MDVMSSYLAYYCFITSKPSSVGIVIYSKEMHCGSTSNRLFELQ